MPPLSAQAIRDMRSEVGASRREVADHLGYTIHSMIDWERKDRKRRPMPPLVEMRFLSFINGRRIEFAAIRSAVLSRAA